ncbi:hypothetical protein [Endozoicomonas sp. ALB122]|uniref:hypothetical protein n=1 Tax=Endozoicomonas sp. ALB122 TaxID=3403075 RepID=UPI003BB5A0E1
MDSRLRGNDENEAGNDENEACNDGSQRVPTPERVLRHPQKRAGRLKILQNDKELPVKSPYRKYKIIE